MSEQYKATLKAVTRFRVDPEVPEGDAAVSFSLSGLPQANGVLAVGQSNACKLMARFLKHIVVAYEARLAQLGSNASSASALVTVPSEVVDELLDEANYYADLFRYEAIHPAESGVVLKGETAPLPTGLLPEEVQDDLLNCLEAAHDGVMRLSSVSDTSCVETASRLELAETDLPEGMVQIQASLYSSNEEVLRWLASQLQSCFILGGMRVEFEK